MPIGVVTLLLTSGCAGPVPEPAASGSAAAGEAFFASEEEAVEAALAVYAEYAATADAIMADGGASPERLEPFADEELYASQLEGFELMQEQGARGTGTTDFAVHEWQQDPVLDRSGTLLAAYMCRDVSQIDVVGPDGTSIVANDRLEVIPTEVVWTISAEGVIRIAKDAPWQAENFCS